MIHRGAAGTEAIKERRDAATALALKRRAQMKRFSEAPPLDEKTIRMKIEEHLRTHGVTQCPPAAVEPIANGVGFDRPSTKKRR